MRDYPTDRGGLEVLPFEECLRLLASVPVGRVGFVAEGEVVMLPVNHLVDGTDVVFCAAFGSKLAAAEGQKVAAFEADHYDQQNRSGWSVLVSGRVELVEAEADVSRLSRRGLHSWVRAAAQQPFWIRIRPTSVSGRQTPAGR